MGPRAAADSINLGHFEAADGNEKAGDENLLVETGVLVEQHVARAGDNFSMPTRPPPHPHYDMTHMVFSWRPIIRLEQKCVPGESYFF